MDEENKDVLNTPAEEAPAAEQPVEQVAEQVQPVQQEQAAQPVQQEQAAQPAQPAQEPQRPTKFCAHCGGKIDEKAVVCPLCGCQVEQLAQQQNPNIVINNSNNNSNVNTQATAAAPTKPPRNKWTALLLCFFLGVLGIHKFYEGKSGMGVLYLFTGGLCGVGVLVDFITLLFKPNPYYV